VFENLPDAFDGFKLLHISDLHLDAGDGIPEAHIDALQRVGTYDICVITGDYRNKTFGPYRLALEAMSRVCEQINTPIFGVLGNHDTIRMTLGLEKLGMRLLLNEALPIKMDDATIWLAGIDDPHYFRADNLEKATDPIPHDAVSILLSHSPEMYRQATYARFDAMLSGHTHGGQICLPGGIPILLNANAPRAFCNGPWRYHGMQGYTSAGSGSCIVDVRLNCPPEMTVHTLRKGSLPDNGKVANQ
jgi:predicted MPP superfamily phosphohydrolase